MEDTFKLLWYALVFLNMSVHVPKPKQGILSYAISPLRMFCTRKFSFYMDF